ncbi:unnamed protein product [Tilletia laevis]|uniref:Uncharacterized protein n=2 Tax=Tilletia TaxID=13289 RepID=A0A9N8QI07_9BASI|nr:unnamed protein product [Tilletia caries]CAD6944148.1 unnamed protein product [Tilletia laevis]CAD6951209.1 unnamed protein product [Tilletia laevis]CAD7061809.1 unnamed protein product [Tilletia caries]
MLRFARPTDLSSSASCTASVSTSGLGLGPPSSSLLFTVSHLNRIQDVTRHLPHSRALHLSFSGTGAGSNVEEIGGVLTIGDGMSRKRLIPH